MPVDVVGAEPRVTSGDGELLDRLGRGSFTSSVHSVFDRAVNLWCHEDQRLYTLAVRGLGNAPGTLVLDVATCQRLVLHEADTVVADGGTLALPSATTIAYADAERWEGQLPPLPMPTWAATWLRSFVAREGVAGGLLARAGVSAAGDIRSAVTELLAAHTAGAVDALRTGNEDGFAWHAHRMIGLGPGLTPAGDDFLLGLMVIANLPGGLLGRYRPLLRRVVDANAARTTAVSHAALAHAARGRAPEALLRLLHALAGGEAPDALATHARRVTAIGHTSGTDILAGMSAALDLDHELRGGT